jgi:long-chain acyl-CoA synthetase
MIKAKRLFDIPYIQLLEKPNETMFVSKVNGTWTPISTQNFIESVLKASKCLIGLGILPGDKVALVSNNRLEWNILDIAIQQVGGIVVPLYPTISSGDYQYILNDASCKICFAGTEEIALKIAEIQDKTPVKHLFTFDQVDAFGHWSTINTYAEGISDVQVQERKDNVQIDDLVTIIYTSGTTGNPKGVMLNHKNLLSNIETCQPLIPVINNSRVLTFLPVCHVYERMLHYLYMYVGCSIYFAESIETIGENIKEVKPHMFTAVPRLIEKVYEKIVAKGEDLTGIKKKLFFWAINVGENFDLKGKSPFYKIQLAIARKLIFSKWQEALGGEVKAIASGSAALQPRLARIFYAAGMPILEGYGLTETSPVVSVNNFVEGVKFGSVGKILNDVKVLIAEDGEIKVKGPNVMLGYYNQDEATSEVMDNNGWFCTGDIGHICENNFLHITDRKKEIFKTSGGKYIVPQMIENKLKASRFIEQAMVIGEGQKFPAAFIVPNFIFIKDWLSKKGYNLTKESSNDDISKIPEVIDRIQKEIDQINSELGSWEQIKKFVLLDNEFTIASNELTPTLKLRRKIILENNKTAFEQIYN